MKFFLFFVCVLLLGSQIFAQGLIVTSPKANDVIRSKSKTTITWQATSHPSVKIEYNINGATVTVVESTPNTGKYNWIYPHNPSSSASNKVVFKITATDNEEVYGKSEKVTLKNCEVKVKYELDPSICINENRRAVNKSENANSYEWILNGNSVSTTKDLDFTLENKSKLENFNLNLKASNGYCADEISSSLESSSINGNCAAGHNTVIQEMVIPGGGGRNQYKRQSVAVATPIMLKSINITHKFTPAQYTKWKWDWGGTALPRFSSRNIDSKRAISDGEVTVTWVSKSTDGVLFDEVFYVLRAKENPLVFSTPSITGEASNSTPRRGASSTITRLSNTGSTMDGVVTTGTLVTADGRTIILE